MEKDKDPSHGVPLSTVLPEGPLRMDDGEVRHDGGHHRNLPNPSPGQIGWGTTVVEDVCERP